MRKINLSLRLSKKFWLTVAGIFLGFGFILFAIADVNQSMLQTDWSGGVSSTVAVHPTNQTGWTKYLAKDTYVDTSTAGKVILSTESHSVSETSDTDFNAGTLSNATVNGTSSAATVKLTGTTNDPFRPTLGKWGSAPQMPRGFEEGAALCYPGSGNFIYAFYGDGMNTFMKYDIENKKWGPAPPAPRGVYDGGSLAYPGSGDFIYALAGRSQTFWKYSISGETWTALKDTPAYVGPGGSLVARNSTTLYAVAGGETQSFWVYDTNADSWTTKGNVPATVNYGSTSAYDPNDTAGGATAGVIYVTRGADTVTLYRYDITQNIWGTVTPSVAFPDFGYGSALVYPGSGTDLYMTIGAYRSDFIKYSVSGNSWSRATELPSVNLYRGGAMCYYSGSPNRIYAMTGGGYENPQLLEYDLSTGRWNKIGMAKDNRGTDGTSYLRGSIQVGNTIYAVTGYQGFYCFDFTTEQWTRKADYGSGWTVAEPGTDSFVYPGSGDYIYLLKGYSPAVFKRYSILGNSWTTLTAPPNGATNSYQDAELIYSASDNTIYCLRAYNTNEFYSYSLGGGDSWTTLATAPDTIQSYNGLTISGSDIYVCRGYNTQDFYKYTIGGGWSTLATNGTVTLDMPSWYNGRKKALMVANNGDLYYNRGYAGIFYKYTGGAWTNLNPGFTTGYPASLHPAGSDYIYLTAGYNSQTFKRLKISTGAWETLADIAMPWQVPNNGGHCSLFYYDPDSTVDSNDEKIYLTTGDVSPQDMLKYDIGTNTWTDGNYNLSLSGRDYLDYGGYGVRAGDYLYYVYGYSNKSFYRYSLANNNWDLLCHLPKFSDRSATLAYPGSGDYLYATTGYGAKDFYRYSLSGNSWAALGDVPVALSSGAASIAPGDGFVYLIAGYGAGFYKYNIGSPAWSAVLTAPPVNPSNGVRFAYNPSDSGNLYCIFPGDARIARYDKASTGTWTWLASAPAAFGASSALTYGGQSDSLFAVNGTALYKYTLGGSWSTLKVLPRATTSGSDIIWGGANYSDILLTSRTDDFFKYSVSQNKWDYTSQAGLSDSRSFGRYGVASIAGVESTGNNYVYSLGGYPYSSAWLPDPLWRYNADTDYWSQMASTPWITTVTWGSTLCYPGSGDYLYAIRGAYSRDFAKYSISSNTWAGLEPIPYEGGTQLWPTALAYLDGYVYTTRGYGTNYFYRYSVANNTWENKAVCPAAVGYGHASINGPNFLCAAGGYIWLLNGYAATDFYRYTPADGVGGGSWSQKANFPTKKMLGGALLYPGFGDYIYAAAGWGNTPQARRGTALFFKYSITQNKWFDAPEIPFRMMYGKLTSLGNYIYAGAGLDADVSMPQLARYNLFASGDFTSQVKEIGVNKEYGTLTWSSTADNSNTFTKIKVKTSNSPTITGIDAGSYATNSQDMSSLSGVSDTDKYLQYKIYLKTTDLGLSMPELQDITFNYLNYPRTAQKLTSSIYDTTEARNRLMKLSWSETLAAGADVRFQLRTSADGTWASDEDGWLGPTGNTSVTYDLSSSDDYSKSSLIKLESGNARLYKDLEDFQYQQAVVVDNTGGDAGSNLVAALNINSTNSAFWSHVNSLGSDIRFYDPTTAAKLVYNLSSFDYTNKSASINIKFPSLGAGEVKTVYMLYGSSIAGSESDANVSACLENFASDAHARTLLDSTEGASFTVSDGIATLSNDNWAWDGWMETKSTYSRVEGRTLYIRFKTSGGVHNMLGWRNSGTGGDYGQLVYALHLSAGVNGYIYENGNQRGYVGSFPEGVWYDLAIKLKAAGGATYYYRQAGSGAWTQLYDSSYSTESNLKLGIQQVNVSEHTFVDAVDIKSSLLTADIGNAGVPSYIPIGEQQTTSATLGANWPYRETIVLTNAGAAKTDYMVSINLDSTHTGFWQHCRKDGVDDGGDIRFIDSNNTTALLYKRNTFDKTAKTGAISVKVPSIPAGTKNIYLYYGNASATDQSNSAVAGDVPASGLIGYYKFNENTGVVAGDSSGQGNSGTISAASWVDGKFGKALSFNGSSSYVQLPEAFTLGLSKFSIGCWIKTTESRSNDTFWNRPHIYGNSQSGAPDSDFGIVTNGGYAGLWSGLSSSGDNNVVSSTLINDNQWHHVLAVYDGGAVKLYVDGVYTNSSISANQPMNGYGYWIGAQHYFTTGGANYYHQGIIDQFVIYNRNLGSSEISDLFYGADNSLTGYLYPETPNAYYFSTYPTTNPTIQPIVGVFYNNDLYEFQQAPTSPPAGSEIKYQVSDNGYEWYWWNSVWVKTTLAYSEANLASEITPARLITFMSSVASSGEFFWRAYLHSNTGASTPLLDQVKVNLTSATSYYTDSTGATAINSSHTDAAGDRYLQYRAQLFSDGQNTPMLDDVTMEYIKPYITLTSPNGAEIWSIGSQHNITWDKDGLTNSGGSVVYDETVKIDYSTDGGSGWTTVAANAPNTGSCQWTVPDTHTPIAKVKVTSNGWSMINDDSNAIFRIVGSVTLISPNGAERWLVGSQHDITWSFTGTMPNVKLEYSINSGSSYSPVIESEGTANDGIVANDGTFNWTIPDTITPADTCLVRVSDSVDSDTKDPSNAAFRIIGALSLTYPTQGLCLLSGAAYNVTWTTTGTISNVDLSYSTNGGSAWRNMAGTLNQVTTVSNTNTYPWTVPDILSEGVKVKVVDHNDSTINSISELFAIRGFFVSSPNGAEEWELGVTHPITWSSGPIIQLPIRIWLSTDGGSTYPILLTTRSSNTGTWNWYIDPDVYVTSDNCKVKLVDAGGREDASDAVFRIMANPVITVTSPALGNEWMVGTEHNITWNNTGNISTDLTIEYSIGGGNYTAVDPAPTQGQISARTYPWTVIDALSDNVQVRVRELSPPQGRDTQTPIIGESAVFKITSPSVTISAPVSGTIWVTGDTSRSITWGKTGTLIAPLLLDYSVDGTTWNNIVNNLAADALNYNWQNIPAGAAGESVLIRISDSRSPNPVTDNSDAITILPHQRITLTKPTPEEALIQGDTYAITWIWDGQASTSNLILKLSTDGGATWPNSSPYLIDTEISNTPATYSWIIPASIQTTQARLKIYDTHDPLVTSTTENFTITIPQVNITSPLANNYWFATGTHNITWQTVGAVSANLSVQYALNGGAWVGVSPAPTAGQISAKSYPWVVPDNVGATCQIKITDNNKPVVTTTSGTFNIVAPTITVVVPNGSETGPNAWVVGTEHTLSWTTTGGDKGAISALRLQYSTGGAWTTITTISDEGVIAANSGSYNWTVADAVSSNVRIKIFDPSRVATTVTSNVFEIKSASVTITAPNGAESWIIGTQHNITWYSLGTITAPLKLYYTPDGATWKAISAFDGENDGTYTWTVPDDYAPGTAKVKLEDSYVPTAHSDVSDKSFTIAVPTITVDTPGVLWSATDTKAITWTPVGTLIGPLKIEWSLDNFGSTNLISNTVDKAAVSHNWTIPETAVSTSVRTRITDLGRTLTWGKNNVFTVLPVPAITVSSPTSANTGNDAWRIGKEYSINWSDNGGAISNDLKLQYSVDNGVSWTDIAPSVANAGTYAWIVALGAQATTQAKVKIYDNTAWKPNTHLEVNSDAFEIAIPRITIASPAGNEEWASGDEAPLTWTSDGFINDNLTLQYSLDNGVNWYAIASGETNDGSYTWPVPDAATIEAKIKIIDSSSDYGGQQVLATSNVFKIISEPQITVAAPNGGETFVLGDTTNITWTSKGLQVQNVKIDYSANDFSTASTIVDSTPNDGSYSWTIPSDALSGSTIKVRVSMVGNANVKDASDVNFRIRGGFDISAPVTAQRCIVGRAEALSWTTRGTMANVKLKYSSDNGATWATVTNSTANSGTYSYILPKPRSTTAKFRVEDATDETVYAESNAFNADYFTINWRVLDYDTNAPLQLLSVRDDEWTNQTKTLTSPVDHDYPYGTYTTFWSKDGYIERALEWTADSEKSVSVALENQLTAMVEWHVLVSTSYNADSDTLKCSAWLERRGKLVGTVETDLQDLQTAALQIYDGTSLIKSFSSSTHDDQGVYWFTWAGSGLEAGKTYFVKATISYRDSSYTSGASIDVTSSKKIQETKTLLQQEALKTTAIKTAVETTIPSKVTEAKDEIKADTAKILTATETTIPAKVDEAREKITDIVKSEILNREQVIRSGQSMIVRFRTHTGLSPELDVYDTKNVQRVVKAPMIELGDTGVYEYTLKFMNGWGRGDFTLVCSESSKGTMDAMTITVLKTDIEQLSGQVSAILGTTSGISSLKSVADTMNSQFSVIESALSKVGKDLVKEVKDAASSATALESVYTQLASVARQIKELTGSSGINLEKLYNVSSEKKQDMTYLKNKTQELKAAMEMSQKMVDNIANKPVTQTWYEYK